MGFIVYLLFDAAMVFNGEDEGILGHVEGVRLDGILKLYLKNHFYLYQGAVAFDQWPVL